MSVFVVMLRAIGPVTHRIMSMAQWREAVAAAGFYHPQTYVNTGNMLMDGDGTPAEVTRRMDEIVLGLGLGKGNKSVVRTPRQLRQLLKADPFSGASAIRPSEIGVHFFAGARPDFDWVKDYAGPEHIHVAGQHLIVHYDGRQSTSRLPGIIEKKSGVVTARNWNTLRGLARLGTEREKSGQD